MRVIRTSWRRGKDMPLKIYGVLRSRASRVVWLAYETGIPFELAPVIQAYRLSDPECARRAVEYGVSGVPRGQSEWAYPNNR